MRKTLILLFLTALAVCKLSAQTFNYLGINYKVTSIKTVEVSNNKGFTGNAVIPDSVTNASTIYKVTNVGDSAFLKSVDLTSIILPQTLSRIGTASFRGCTGLKGITIPDFVTEIGNKSFSFCTGLKSLNLGDSVQTIGNEAFSNCIELTTLYLPEKVTHIGNYAFYYCININVLYLGKLVTTIGNNAFESCRSLSQLSLGNSVLKVGNNSFADCTGIKTLNLGIGITNIGEYVFSSCTNLKSISLPASLTSIGNGAFSRCTSLSSIIVPNLVTNIGAFAFSRCTSLKSVVIPKSVTQIGNNAFFRCDILSSVTVNWTNPLSINPGVFELAPIYTATLYVPTGTYNIYKATAVWQYFGTILAEAALPLVLINFNAKLITAGNIISWETAAVVNLKSITLERLDGNNSFVPLVTLPPTSSHYIDFSPLAGNNYYRLSSTDNDGTVHTYNKIAVVNGLEKQISIYPNPVTNSILTVVASNQNILNLTLINQNGIKVVKVPNCDASKKVEINTQGIAKGIYFLQIEDNKKTTFKKIVVN